MHLPKFGQTITNAQKRIIFGPPTQALLPLKYHYVYDQYKNAIKNNWTPEEIGLASDKLDYKELPAGARNQWDKVLSMLTVMDMIVTDCIGEHIMPAASAPEFRSWLARQQFEEANHSDSYAYIIDGIGLEQQAVFDRYLTDATLYAKVEMANKAVELLTHGVSHNTFYSADVYDPADELNIVGIESFLKGYAFFPLVLEGLWFIMGLKCGTYATHYHRKMRGTSDQFAYILRDETLHVAVGIHVINVIKSEYSDAWTVEVREYIISLIKKGIELEKAFALSTYQQLPGLEPEAYINHCKYQAELLLNRIGLSAYSGTFPALSWLSGAIEMRKETNFFERKVTEYQQGGLNWEE